MIIGVINTHCALCGTKHDVNIVQELKTAVYKDQYVNYYATVYQCDNCPVGENEFIGLNQEKSNALNIIDEYRRNNYLITSDQIIALREKYDLTSVELSKIFNWDENLVEKYETILAQDFYHNEILYKAINNPSFFYHCVNKNKNILNANRLTKLNLKLLHEIKKTQDYFED